MSSEGLSLASDFFFSPWPWPRALCPRLHLWPIAYLINRSSERLLVLLQHYFGGNNLQRWSRGHKARGQGHKKNPRPRPRTAFPRTDTLEAKDRNALGQGQEPRTQAQVLSKKKKRSSQKFFRRSPRKKKVFTKIFQAISKKKKGLHKNFSSDLHKKTFSK